MLPFSREVYYAQFAQLNESWWWAQVLAGLLVLGLLAGLLKPGVVRSAWMLSGLALLWAGMAGFWFFQVHAEFNFLAPIYGGAVVLQALALGGTAFRAGGNLRRTPLGIVLIFLALGYPLADLVFGPGWPMARVPGLFPEPVLLATTAVVLAMPGPGRWSAWLLALPLLLAGVTGYNAWVLGMPHDFLVPAAVLLGLAVRLRKDVGWA